MEDYRCFSNPSDDNSSSDYILRKKQKTIYTDVLKQYPNNFIKHNGLNYTENFVLNGRCLGFAKSYELLTDIKRGNCSNSSNIPNLNSYEAWSGSLYSVNYSANNVNTVVDTSYNAGNGNQIIFPMTQPAELADISWNGLYPGVIIDPSYLIFDPECMENSWRNKLVEVSFNNTNYYIQSNKLSSNYNYRTSCCLIPLVVYGTAVAYNGQIYVSYDSGETWIAKDEVRFWTSIAMSADGSRQSAVVDLGQIYVSTDFGDNWVPKDADRKWSSIAMSADGRRQTAVVNLGKIYVSTDFGNTWVPKDADRIWKSIAMSADGRRQTAVVNLGKIYVSTDFGNTWVEQDEVRFWTSIAMSADGSRQTAVVNLGKIYVSTDFGDNWVEQDADRLWRSIAMSADGSRQTAVVFNGQIYVSTDFGDNWVPKDSNRKWLSIAMSADGSRQTAGSDNEQIYVSSNFGDTWVAKDANRFWGSIAMAS
jgi:photosystem II stability/assembly factor-like uncharacterized protein